MDARARSGDRPTAAEASRSLVRPTPTLQQIVNVRTYILDEGDAGSPTRSSSSGPKITHVNYKARIWLFPNVSADLALSAIENAVAALIEKQRWLGYDHSRMAFDAALAQAGVHHAVIDEPYQDAVVDDRGIVQVDMVDVSSAGGRMKWSIPKPS